MKNGRLLTAVVVASFALVFSCRAGEAGNRPKNRHLTPLEVAEMIVSGKERVFLLDVRNEWEAADYHIPGAVNIPVQVLGKPENLAKVPKNRKVILYCRTGVRSERALALLRGKGYDAYSMEGGVAAWWRDIIQPPSLTMAPFGKRAALFRKRQGLRNYFLNLPGAGPAFPAPKGPPLVRGEPPAAPSRRGPRKERKGPAREPGNARPSPLPGGPPALQNPCG